MVAYVVGLGLRIKDTVWRTSRHSINFTIRFFFLINQIKTFSDSYHVFPTAKLYI